MLVAALDVSGLADDVLGDTEAEGGIAEDSFDVDPHPEIPSMPTATTPTTKLFFTFTASALTIVLAQGKDRRAEPYRSGTCCSRYR
ncbi:hypothetical protein GCM10011381_09090 [Klenkia taihuensis]|nr:hypothetical protein GCM10011381_09090 [Klenkia taihuensis]